MPREAKEKNNWRSIGKRMRAKSKPTNKNSPGTFPVSFILLGSAGKWRGPVDLG